MFGLLLLVAQFAQIFATSQCVYGDTVCWVNYTNKVIIPKLAIGIPELGIESLHKIKIKDIDFNDDETVLKLTNATVLGFESSLVEDIRNYIDWKIVRIIYDTNLTLVADYSTKGTFFTLPISGNGKMTYVLKNVHVELLAPYDIIKHENGKNRLSLKYFKKSFHSYGGIDLKFENKDKDNNGFDEKVNTLVNENWRVFEEYSAKAWSDYTQQVFNAVKLILASYDIKK